jgi:WD40 repeat protein
MTTPELSVLRQQIRTYYYADAFLQSAMEGRSQWIQLSPDENWVMGSGSGNPTIWSVKERHLRSTFADPTQMVPTAFAPKGDLVATSSLEGTVRVWRITDGAPVSTVNGSKGYVWAISFSPDGSLLATADADFIVRVWQVASGREVWALTGHTSRVACCAFSHDGKTVLTGSDDGTARLWDVSTGKEAARFNGHGKYVTAACFSPDNKFIAVAGENGEVQLRDANSRNEVAKFRHSSAVSSFSFSKDSKQILGISSDGYGRVWDVATRKMQVELSATDPACLATDCSFLGGTRILSAGLGDLFLWDGQTGNRLCRIEGIRRATPLSDGRIVTIESDYRVAIRARVRPEQWWGLAWLPEFWIAILLLMTLGWSLWRDRRLFRKRAGSAASSQITHSPDHSINNP